MFTVAIIGRPNVGKSTLFNRLTGKPHAIVEDTPGVTRDWREGEGRIGPLNFRLLDTAGLDEAAAGSLEARMTEHSLRTLKQADVVLLVIDGRAGLTPVDQHFASVVRKSGTPVILVVNKAESAKAVENALADAYRLGLGEPVAISAAHGEGLVGLYEALVQVPGAEGRVPSDEDNEENSALSTHDSPLTIAIVGRPNAGKSTLINKLLKEERVLTGPEAGITRDAIAIPFEWKGRALKLVDTAGLRRRANITQALEKMSATDTLRAIQYAHVVVLMMDAQGALEKQDLQIASLVEKEGRALVLVINKWDLVPKDTREKYLQAVEERMDEVLQQTRGVPVITLTAEKGEGIQGLMKAVFDIERIWNTRIGTSDLNRWLEAMLAAHAPPLIDGLRLKLRYATQIKTRPPTFAISSNLTDVPDHYLRYLSNGLRDSFGLRGVPLRFKLKKSKNPYERKKKRDDR